MSPLPRKAAEQMFAHLSSVYPMSQELIKDLSRAAEYSKEKRLHYLLQPGEINDRLYYIHKGLLRCFYIHNVEKVDARTGEKIIEEKEVSTQFMRERDTCVSVESFYLQQPSYEYIQTLEATELFSISKVDLDEIYLKHLEFNFTGRKLTINYLVDWVRQINGIRKMRVAERYETLRQRDPEMVNRVPQKYLASYLDTEPETISRLRANY